MLWAAQRKGWEIWYMEQQDLYLRDGKVLAKMAPMTVAMDPDNFFQRGEYQIQEVCALDAVLMRKDPPFDNEFIYTTHLLEIAAAAGDTLMVNRPQALRDYNEKSLPHTSRNAARRYWLPAGMTCCANSTLSTKTSSLNHWTAWAVPPSSGFRKKG